MTNERKEANSNLNKAETAILKPSLTQCRFIKRAYGSYYRITDNDLLQAINIQKHSWQKTFTVNLSISQLYQGLLNDHLPAVTLIRQSQLYTDAYRQENNIERADHWFDFSDIATANRSMETLNLELEKFITPFFDSLGSNKSLAGFVFERTFNQTRSFIQPDISWSNYLAGLLALRIEDNDNASYFLRETSTHADMTFDWGKKLFNEANKLQDMLKSNPLLISDYFQQNISDNIKRNKLKI